MKVLILRDCGLGNGKNAVKDEVVDVDADTGAALIGARAGVAAPEDAEVGAPKKAAKK